jgi:hypothetical protein
VLGVLGQKRGGEGNNFDEEKKQDGGNEGILISAADPNELGDEREFKDSAPEAKPKRIKSRLEQLEILKPEKRELRSGEKLINWWLRSISFQCEKSLKICGKVWIPKVLFRKKRRNIG